MDESKNARVPIIRYTVATLLVLGCNAAKGSDLANFFYATGGWGFYNDPSLKNQGQQTFETPSAVALSPTIGNTYHASRVDALTYPGETEPRVLQEWTADTSYLGTAAVLRVGTTQVVASATRKLNLYYNDLIKDGQTRRYSNPFDPNAGSNVDAGFRDVAEVSSDALPVGTLIDLVATIRTEAKVDAIGGGYASTSAYLTVRDGSSTFNSGANSYSTDPYSIGGSGDGGVGIRQMALSVPVGSEIGIGSHTLATATADGRGDFTVGGTAKTTVHLDVLTPGASYILLAVVRSLR